MREERARLRLTHEWPDDFSWHIFHNFADDLWAQTRGDRRWSVDLGDLDFARHRFEVVVRRSVLKRSVAFVQALLDRHLLGAKVRIDVLDEP